MLGKWTVKNKKFFPVIDVLNRPEAEFNEVEPRLKFKTWLKYGWLL